LLEEIVRIITSRQKIWVDTMMKEELGLIEDGKNPLDNSVSTFIGFNLIGLIPLIPFMIFMIMKIDANSEAFVYSTISVIVSFFLVGMIKGKIVKKPKIRSGFYTLIIGGIASLVAYFVGYGLKILIQ
jgi:VIT1/CCC1 family predicted Fe2+/Mn2+ transporter